MAKPLSYSFISYEEYKADKDSMSGIDASIHQSFTYDGKGLTDLEQMIASLRCVIPEGPVGVDHYETIASLKNVTGMAYSCSKVE